MTEKLKLRIAKLKEQIAVHEKECAKKCEPLYSEMYELSHRLYLTQIPWHSHSKDTLSSIIFHPTERLAIEEIVPEPQKTWVFEIMAEYYKIGSTL